MSQPVQRKMRRTNTYIGWNIGVDVLHVKGGKGERRRSGRRMRRRRRKMGRRRGRKRKNVAGREREKAK